MSMNPLHQFEIHEIAKYNLGGFEVQITNQSLWMIIATVFIAMTFALGVRKKAQIPGKLQAAVEITFEFVENLLKDTTGAKGLKYLPIIFTIFLFIATLNVFGMIPGTYTSTSQIFITGALAVSVFVFVILVGLFTHGLKFFGLFLPHGTPVALAPLIVILEVISFFSRPFSLAVRLGANMMAGHILLKIVASFVIMLGGVFAASFVIPFTFLVALSVLELFVALLQAYIFTVLTCVYLNDAINLH